MTNVENCKYYDAENGWCKKLSDWHDAMPDIEYCVEGHVRISILNVTPLQQTPSIILEMKYLQLIVMMDIMFQQDHMVLIVSASVLIDVGLDYIMTFMMTRIFWILLPHRNIVFLRLMKNAQSGAMHKIKGKLWITNGEINKKIKPEEYAYYESIGFYGCMAKPLATLVVR